MADWKVSAERIEVFPHPNADRMEVAKVGMFPLVVGKDNGYKTGDIVIFAPKRAILPLEIRDNYKNFDTGISYLRGDDCSRVSSVRLRGELSEGVTIDREWVMKKLGVARIEDIPLGEDLAERLGIGHYIPPLPIGFDGIPYHLPISLYAKHDVEQMVIYEREFTPGEAIVATEKLHGTQCAVLVEPNGTRHVTSKSLLDSGIGITEEAGNIYWRAAHNVKIFDLIAASWPGKMVQVFGEAVPAQGGNWTYGVDTHKPEMRVYRVVVDGVEVALDYMPAPFVQIWVPVVYRGPFDLNVLRPLAKGKEWVSGKELHKREGVVIMPLVPRRARDGFNLMLKLISPDFKGSDDDLS